MPQNNVLPFELPNDHAIAAVCDRLGTTTDRLAALCERLDVVPGPTLRAELEQLAEAINRGDSQARDEIIARLCWQFAGRLPVGPAA